MAKEFTDGNFQEVVLDSGQLSVIDFWAPWCGPCKMVGPIVDQLAQDFDGKAVIGKVNVDDNPGVSSKYGVRSIPTLLFIKDGEVVDKLVGAASKNVIQSKIEQHI